MTARLAPIGFSVGAIHLGQPALVVLGAVVALLVSFPNSDDRLKALALLLGRRDH